MSGMVVRGSQSDWRRKVESVRKDNVRGFNSGEGGEKVWSVSVRGKRSRLSVRVEGG